MKDSTHDKLLRITSELIALVAGFFIALIIVLSLGARERQKQIHE
jgi:preprotein translocase subunit SecG